MQQEEEKEFETLNGTQRVTVMLWKSDPTRQRSEHISLKLLSNNGERIHVSLWEGDCGSTHHLGNPNDIHFHSSYKDESTLGNPSHEFDLYSLDVNKMIATFNNFRSAQRSTQSPWSAFGNWIDRLFDNYEMTNTNRFLLALLNEGGIFSTLRYKNPFDYLDAFDKRRLRDPHYLIQLGCQLTMGNLLAIFMGANIMTLMAYIMLPLLIVAGPWISESIISFTLLGTFAISTTGTSILLSSTTISRNYFNYSPLLKNATNLCLSATRQERDKFIHVAPTRITALIQKIRWEIDRLKNLPWFKRFLWWGATKAANDKANALQSALTRALKITNNAITSAGQFLKSKFEGQPSILDIANRRRSSLTSNPTTTYQAIMGALSHETTKYCLIDRFAELGLNSDTIAKFTTLIFNCYKGGYSATRLTEAIDIEKGAPDQSSSFSN